MTAASISFSSVKRHPACGPEDELQLTSGVNVLVGPPNTGKSVWLRMMDFMMGDTGRPEDTFCEQVLQKYEVIEAVVNIAGQDVLLERRLKQHGMRSKIIINGDPIDCDQFSEFLLPKLGMSVLHYPQGNPYSERSWPLLSWRTLLRHMYRRDEYWSDLADRQPQSEQHAALAMVLGLADTLFPEQLGQLIEKRKQLMQLQAHKSQFESLLQGLTKDIIADPSITISLTPESVQASINNLQEHSASLTTVRDATIEHYLSQYETGGTPPHQDDDRELLTHRQRLISEQQAAKDELDIINTRLQQLTSHQTLLDLEHQRLQRLEAAGALLADLRITHCPACDQEIHTSTTSEQNCFLCHQPTNNVINERTNAGRISFELEQVSEEQEELKELIHSFGAEQRSTEERIAWLKIEIERVDNQLKPLRSAAAAALPPQISVIDMQIGQISERIAQLNRVLNVLGYRDLISAQMTEVEAQSKAIEACVASLDVVTDYEGASDRLTDGLNTYLNKLNEGDPQRWQKRPVRFSIGERRFSLKIGNDPWSSQLGATLKCYLLMGYHYALLGLSGEDNFHYPGLCLIDFPPTLADGAQVADKENYLVEPFIAQASAKPDIQLIVTGRAFAALEGVHRIELTKVWG